MSHWLLAGVAGWCVLRLFGVDRRYPWRIGELLADPTGAQRPRPLDRRTRRRASGPPPPPSLRSRPSPRSRRRGGEPSAELVAVADLLHVAVSAGHSLHGAVAAVGATADGPAGVALARVDAAFARGRPMADALEELTRAIGPEARPLVTALSSSLRSGAPLAPGLQRLADAQRRRQRRRAEERIRRLPVLLLAPLVGLVLPAFVVLTIVPVALTTARTGLTPAIGQSAPPPIPTRSPP
jgi:hypothetical protein